MTNYVYLIHGDLTTYGEFKDHKLDGSHVAAVTVDPDEADVYAEIEAKRYAAQASAPCTRTSKHRWEVREKGEFLYTVTVERREDTGADLS